MHRLPSPCRFEQLEPRCYLAADFTGTFDPLPPAVPAGTEQEVRLTVQNIGSTGIGGGLVVDLFAVPEGEEFIPGVSLPFHRTRMGGLPASGQEELQMFVKPTLDIGQGNYRLVALIDSGNSVAEINEENNIVYSSSFAITAPDLDLVVAVTRDTIAPAIVSGEAKRAIVKVRVTNSAEGSVQLPRRQRVAVQIVARPVDATDDSQDVVISREGAFMRLRGLAPGQSVTRKIRVDLPETLRGEFVLLATADSVNQISEFDETNNTVAFAGLRVDDPFVELGAAVGRRTNLPHAMLTGATQRAALAVDVVNLGNVRLERGQRVDVGLLVRRLSDDATFSVGPTQSLKVGALRPGASRTLRLRPTLGPLEEGDYVLQAVVTPQAGASALVETDESAAISVRPPFVDVAATDVSVKLPAALTQGTDTLGRARVRITNSGNVGLPSDERVDILALLRPVGATDGSGDLGVGFLRGKNVGGLDPGRSRTFSVQVGIGTTVPEGQYNLLLSVVAAEGVDSEPSNNQITSDQTISISTTSSDLTIASARTDLGRITDALTEGVGVARIRNVGSEKFDGEVDVEFFATRGGVIDEFAISMGIEEDVDLDLSPGRMSQPVTVELIAPDPTITTFYTIVARVSEGSSASDDPDNVFIINPPLSVEPAHSILGELGPNITILSASLRVQDGMVLRQEGTYMDSRGQSGSYVFSVPDEMTEPNFDGLLELTPDDSRISGGRIFMTGRSLRDRLNVGTHLQFAATRGDFEFSSNIPNGELRGRVTRFETEQTEQA